MLTINLPTEIERHFKEVVQKNYNGDVQEAIASLLKLHDKYGWKEQLHEDVEAIRAEVRRKGGITSQAIDDAINTYRKTEGGKGARGQRGKEARRQGGKEARRQVSPPAILPFCHLAFLYYLNVI